MTFDDITQDGRLWAVKYDNDEDNILDKVFEQWSDIVWLRAFFIENKDDLASYFKVTDVNQAIYDTIEDADKLQCLILDISPNANLDQIFRHLEPSRTSETVLGKEKAKGANARHASWLRLYAIKLSAGVYIITGGAIKLTATMQERAHTLAELLKMEQVRNFLISKDVIDDDGFKDYLREL
ncbi:MAG: hypothetical protein HUK11_06765 [Muribaculaceae bacterium]|nr:hypothetical protein [Muribaculaceae bacterium]